MARHTTDSGENDHQNASAADLLAEVEALRRRLAALEERLPGNEAAPPPGRPAKWRPPTNAAAYLTAGTVLGLLAGASLVYGQGAVQSGADALSISANGNVGIGTVAPAAALDVGRGLLHIAGNTAATAASEGAYLGWNGLTGGTGETDFINNQGNGSGGFAFMNTPSSGDPRTTLMFVSGAGYVGIGTTSPSDKLTVDGSARMKALNVDGGAVVAGDASVKGLTVAGPMQINGKNSLEFGAGVAGKEGSAGKIGYQLWSDGLDIVGAGTTNTNRKIKLFAEGGATLDGSLKVSGVVDGNMKVVYQRDDDAPTTYEKPLWRYHMSLTAAKYGGRTKTIPSDTLKRLCGKPDGCEVRLGMTRWDDADKTQTASIVNRFYYSPQDGHWRVNWPRDTEGVIKNGGPTQHAMNAWNECFFTDGTFDNYQDRGDRGTGMQLLVGNGNGNNPARTCELTLIP